METPSAELLQAVADFGKGGPRVFEQEGHTYYFVREGNQVHVSKDRDPEAPKEKYTVPGRGWPFNRDWLYREAPELNYP